MTKIAVMLALALAADLLPAAAGESLTDPPPATAENYSETVEVELVTVPFYAVDRDGAPVYDLRSDEVELLVDGKPQAIDSFDRYGAPAPTTSTPASARPRLLPPGTHRHVLMFFDLTFSNPRGLAESKLAAAKLLDRLPESDWLYLLRYNSQAGVEQLEGPVAASQAGRAQIAAKLKTLEPEVGRVALREDLPTIQAGSGKNALADDSAEDAYRNVHESTQAQYAAEARHQAGALELLATFVRQLQGPKLLLFYSQGIDSGLYNQGSEIHGRTAALRGAFEPALKALAASGAMPIFVNAYALTDASIEEGTEFAIDGEANSYLRTVSRGESTLQQMAEVSGGIVLAHTNTSALSERLVDWTSAYYEVGYYPDRALLSAASELRIKRPGVSLWTPKGTLARRSYQDLSDRERQFLAVDLVLRGGRAGAARDLLDPRFLRLEGSFERAQGEAAGKVRFTPAWPGDTRMKALDVYSVVLDLGAEARTAHLRKLNRFAYSPTGRDPGFEVQLPQGDHLVWGIVAVEPGSGTVLLRRIDLQPAPTPQGGSAAGR